MSQCLIHTQRVIGDKPSVLGLISYCKAELADQLKTQNVILICAEVWKRKKMKPPHDLWAKGVHHLEHMKYKDFEECQDDWIQKIKTWKETEECEYEFFVEAILIYLQPIIKEEPPEEPPLHPMPALQKIKIENDEKVVDELLAGLDKLTTEELESEN